MNPTSLVFALVMAGIVAATAWFIDWGARRHGHWSARKRRLMRRFMFVLTVATALYAYFTDARLRNQTLFEFAGPWKENEGKTWTFPVEHPGIEHSLMIRPFVQGVESARHPVTLRVRFGKAGEASLIATDTEHPVVAKSGRNAAGRTWREASFRFTPEKAGPHELKVESAGGPIPPRLHLRVVDPEKRNGRRAAGY